MTARNRFGAALIALGGCVLVGHAIGELLNGTANINGLSLLGFLLIVVGALLLSSGDGS